MLDIRNFLKFIYIIILVVVAVRDQKERKIDNRSSVLILVLAVCDLFLLSDILLMDRILGAVIVSFPMLALTMVRPGAFGGGDIKWMAANGCLIGYRAVGYAAIIAIFSAGIYGVIMILLGRYKKEDEFAFGPFLCLGLLVSCLYFFRKNALPW